MSERILIVDDDPDILQVVKINLELEGYDVDTADDGEEAVDKAMVDPPQLILLDIMMPRMDGLTALRRLRSQAPPATPRHPAHRPRPPRRPGAGPRARRRRLHHQAVRHQRTGGPGQGGLAPHPGGPRPFPSDRSARATSGSARRSRPGSGSGSDFALVHCDLDNFKAFNDHYGFMRGDEVIRFCARASAPPPTRSGDATPSSATSAETTSWR